uniref:Uncharacterized protein n=1 Tax=Helianthus annuus TaxID=4232 RepID=A0A251SV03_HELAN
MKFTLKIIFLTLDDVQVFPSKFQASVKIHRWFGGVSSKNQAPYHHTLSRNPSKSCRYLSSASGIMAYLVVVDACFVT